MLSYSELSLLKTFEERYDYLRLSSTVAMETFGEYRINNQLFYRSALWKRTRSGIIVRDGGCDLGHNDYPVLGVIFVHHINPITITDIRQRRPCLVDPNNLIAVSRETHNALHYGVVYTTPYIFEDRSPNDTTLW